MKPSRCPYCGALVAWFQRADGRQLAINPTPDERGNVVLEQALTSSGPLGARRARVLGSHEHRPDGRWLYVPHSATCKPWQEAQRRRRRAWKPAKRGSGHNVVLPRGERA